MKTKPLPAPLTPAQWQDAITLAGKPVATLTPSEKRRATYYAEVMAEREQAAIAEAEVAP